MLTSDERNKLIDAIEALPGQLRALLDGLTAEELVARPLAGEWSVAQNIHHLPDSHMNSYIRLKLILTEENPPLKGYDQDVWAEMVDAIPPELETSLQLLEGLHVRWVQVFRNLTEAEWQRTGQHSEMGAVSIQDLVKIYASHGEEHIDQIQRTLAAQRG